MYLFTLFILSYSVGRLYRFGFGRKSDQEKCVERNGAVGTRQEGGGCVAREKVQFWCGQRNVSGFILYMASHSIPFT